VRWSSYTASSRSRGGRRRQSCGPHAGDGRICVRSDTVNQEHVGSDFDDFLREERLFEVTEAMAIKRVIAYQIAQEMRHNRLTKSEMAGRMRTSRAALDRLLDPANPSVTLATLERAAAAVGKRLKVELM
jgi:antitoxin HicB